MSREIDERIVAMYFDNKNFESGAQQAIKTLEELKKSCNMDGVGEGFEAFSDISKKLNLDGIRKNTDKVKSSFEGLGRVAKNAFNSLLSPIQTVKREIDTLNGYVAKVFGIDLASKIVNGLENTFRNLTIAPISAGWSQYENTMDSVKTIMSSTGDDIETVKGKLAEMTEYANQTIYSLNDMTSNLGKFTNNGVKLDDATNAMIGLANATADAGQGAAQASMAMYNVSQAIGVGKMTTIDWKSLENANIATVKLKQTFIDAAVAHGMLERKVEKDKESGEEIVKYYTKAEKGSKAMEVSVENFRETLNKGWLEKAAILDTFAIFSGQLTVDEIAALGYSKEESARLYQIGQEAMKAATEVRTFSKMMDALKESVQSSWATSFEYIFGDMEEGTNLWTSINDRIDKILQKSSENRNNILMSWRGLMKDEDGQIRKIRDVYENRKEALRRDYDAGRISAERYAEELAKLEETLGDKKLWIDYREIAIETFNNIFDIVGTLSGAVKGAWTDGFGEFTADSLKNLTQGFREFVDGNKKWLGSADDASSRISKLRKGLSGVFTVIKIGLNVVKSVVEIGWNVIKPFIDPLLNLFAKFGEWMNLGEAKTLGDIIKLLSDKFKNLWNNLTKLGWKGAFEKIGEWFSNVWTNIKTGVRNWMNENGLGGIVDAFSSIRDKFVEGIDIVKEWWETSGVGPFFRGIWEGIMGLFRPVVEYDYVNGSLQSWYADSPIISFFKSIKSGVETAWEEVSSWEGWDAIGNFFRDIWDKITGVFKPTVDYGYVNGSKQSWYADSPIVAFFKSIKSGVETAWEEVSSWEGWNRIGSFFSNIWNKITGAFKPVVEHGRINGTLQSWYADSPIVSFFKSIKSGVETAWEEVSSWEGWDAIGNFFRDIWDKITGVFKPTVDYGYVNGSKQSWYADSPIVSFFKSIKSSVETAWEEVSSWEGWDAIGNFFRGLWDKITGAFKPTVEHGRINGTLQSWYADSPIVSFFKSIKSGVETAWNEVKSWEGWDAIGDFFKGIWDKVTGVFKPVVEHGRINGTLQSWYADPPIVSFFNSIKSGVETAWNNITTWEGWAEIGKFFSDTWNWIIGKSGEEASSTDTGKTEVAAEAAEEKVGLVQSIIGTLTGFWESATGWVKEVGGSDIAARFLDSITKILEIIATVAEKVINLAHSALVKGDIGSIIELVGVIGGLLTLKFFSDRSTHDLAKLSDNASGIGSTMLQIAGAIALISFASSMLGKIPTGELVQGIVAVVAIATALFFVTSKLTALNTVKNAGAEPTRAWERVLGKLISIGGAAMMLSTLVEGLPRIIDSLSYAKELSGLTGDDVMKPLLGMMAAISGIMIALSVSNKIIPSGIDPIAAFKTVISVVGGLVIAGGLLLGAGGLLEVLGADPESIKNKMERIAAFLEGFGDGINALFRGLLGISHAEGLQEAHAERNFENTKSLLTHLSEMTGGLDTTQLTSLMTFMSTITEMTKMSEGFDSGKLVNFSGTIEHLVEGLLKFTDLFTGGYTWTKTDEGIELQWLDGFTKRGTEEYERLMTAIDIIRQFYNVFNPDLIEIAPAKMRDWQNYFSEAGSLDKIIENMNAIIDSAGNLHDASGIQFDGIAIVTKFYDSIAEAFSLSQGDASLPVFDATPIVNAIVDAIEVGDVAIKEAVKMMIQSGMNLVQKEGVDPVDLSQYKDLLDWSSWLGDGSDTENAVNGVTQQVSEMVGEVEKEVGSTVEGVKTKTGLNLKVGGITFDDSFIESIKTQLADLQTQFDSQEEYQIIVRPILDTTDFDTSLATFRSQFEGSQLAGIEAFIDLGSQPLPINDRSIVDELRSLRSEVRECSNAIQSVLYVVDSDISRHVDGVTSAVRNIRIPSMQTSLKAIDEGLYRASVLATKTGVLAYPSPVQAPVPLKD